MLLLIKKLKFITICIPLKNSILTHILSLFAMNTTTFPLVFLEIQLERVRKAFEAKLKELEETLDEARKASEANIEGGQVGIDIDANREKARRELAYWYLRQDTFQEVVEAYKKGELGSDAVIATAEREINALKW